MPEEFRAKPERVYRLHKQLAYAVQELTNGSTFYSLQQESEWQTALTILAAHICFAYRGETHNRAVRDCMQAELSIDS